LPSGRPDGLNDTGSALWTPTAADVPDLAPVDEPAVEAVDYGRLKDHELVAEIALERYEAALGA
jgi:hypothetical protein